MANLLYIGDGQFLNLNNVVTLDIDPYSDGNINKVGITVVAGNPGKYDYIFEGEQGKRIRETFAYEGYFGTDGKDERFK